MSKDIKKALEHCVDWDCGNCPNRDELGSGETVCRGRLLQEVLEYVADLEAKLAESEKLKESYRLQNEHHHLQLLQFYSRLGVEVFGADIHEKALETLMIMKEQLAEKDKAIENWQTMYESVVQTCHNDKEEIERLNKQHRELTRQHEDKGE